jgi:DNA repair exonuclease SbcCD ATPase subunit
MEAELAAAVEERLEQQRRASDLEAQLEASKSIAQQEQRGLAARASNLAAQLEKVKGEAAKVCAITRSPEPGTSRHKPARTIPAVVARTLPGIRLPYSADCCCCVCFINLQAALGNDERLEAALVEQEQLTIQHQELQQRAATLARQLEEACAAAAKV